MNNERNNALDVNDIPDNLYKILILSSENDDILVEFNLELFFPRFVITNKTLNISADVLMGEFVYKEEVKVLIDKYVNLLTNKFKNIEI